MMAAEKRIEFCLNQRFYSKESILESIDSFKEICTVNFDENNFSLSLELKKDADPQRVVNEFCNHCLAAMK